MFSPRSSFFFFFVFPFHHLARALDRVFFSITGCSSDQESDRDGEAAVDRGNAKFLSAGDVWLIQLVRYIVIFFEGSHCTTCILCDSRS